MVCSTHESVHGGYEGKAPDIFNLSLMPFLPISLQKKFHNCIVSGGYSISGMSKFFFHSSSYPEWF
jgi:hypothetical protein